MDTLRVIYQGIHSKPSGGLLASDYVNWTVLRISWPPIHSTSIVLISASECSTDNIQRFTPIFERFVGDAAITVRNIAPQEGLVDFWIYVDWENPLDVAVDLVVLDPPNLMVVVDSDLQNQEVFQVDVSPQNKATAFLAGHLSKGQLEQYQEILLQDYGMLGRAVASVKPSRKRKRIKK
jgi:hypothetical protein